LRKGTGVFVEAYDADSLAKVAIYAGSVNPEEYERSVDLAWSMARDAQREPGSKARIIVIVETDEQPSASIRKRLAEADKTMPHCDFAFVTRSLLARAAMTTFYWLSPERKGRRRKVFDSFEEAREWLVAEGAREVVLDALHQRARSELAAQVAKKRRA
jgi:hypothetical protein